ncbi:hypothetical protein AAFP35_15595 [Gordonia sp. CPCC 206044]|uniref:hypothetical protein n=1 Tax=Gordonia sp. CPCC 206044 TaxID=3140793 RepID=UPI003AF37EA0
MHVRQKSGQHVTTTAVLVAVVSVIAVLVGPAAIARAVPGDPPAPLSLRDIGASPTITFPGQQGEVSLSVPVPPDLSPSVLRGTTQLPSFATGGNVDVLQGDRLISRTPINPSPNAPIELPLRGVEVSENAADLTLRAYLRVEGICQFDPETSFRINNATITYTGREAIPTTVAEFLPPVLRGLTIYVPDDVQQAEGASAVNLATAVVAHYGTAPVPIRTVALPRGAMTPPSVPGPLERQIVINSDAPPGVSVQRSRGSSYLVIGGSGEELLTQTEFLTSNLASIALSSSAVAGTLHSAPQLAPDVQTLADLGVTDQTVTSAAWPTITFGIDQTRLGRSAKGVRVQLSGSYSPGPGDANTSISVRVGDRVIDTIKTDGSGTYDTWVDIPDDVLTRYTEVTLTLERSDLGEGCGTGHRSTLSLNSSGEIRSDEADPPQPGGLASLPQTLMPRTQLAWTKGDVGDVSRAVQIGAGLQSLSAVPLGFDVVSVDTAGSSEQPAVLISADGTGLPDLDLPLQTDNRTLSVVSSSGERQASTVTLNPGIQYGAVEVARDDNRTVLVATSTEDSGDLDALLRWLGTDDRWGSVSGDAIMQVADHEPVRVATDEVNPPETDSGWTASWPIVVAIAVGAAVVAGLIVLGTLLMRRRRRPEQP